MIEKLKQNEELWDLFTKKEEYNLTFSDQDDRFPYYLSCQRDVFDPKVSRFLVENGLRPEYPEGKKFAVCLTHDIDFTYPAKMYTIVETAKAVAKGNLVDAVKMPFSSISKRYNPYWNFREIMDLEAKYNSKSSFYFLALNPGEKDFNYKIENLEAELKFISDHGWEVGLHGGYESYNSLEDLKEKKQRLERVLGKQVIGYRNHYLRFKVQDTWELLSKAGFKYDATFGYSDCAGFRNGLCHPFRPYNLNTEKQIDILELPLIIMDRTLLKDYMRLDFKKAWELIKRLIDKVEQCNGVVTTLWHNNMLAEEQYRKLYENLLEYVSSKNAWISSGEEVFNWWTANVEKKY